MPQKKQKDSPSVLDVGTVKSAFNKQSLYSNREF